MIFSELYSAYYNTVAKILTAAMNPNVTEKELQRQVMDNAFSESVLTILPNLKSGKWPLMTDGTVPIIKHIPTRPLTALEKQWLKAICDDPRIKLFDVNLPELAGVEPLFKNEDYRIYDKYSDGDPFEDENYIENFRLLLTAVKKKRPVKIKIISRNGREVWVRCLPKGLEYSLKDDKIRVLADGCKYGQFNLGKISKCKFYNGNGAWNEKPEAEIRKLTILITDERNALERIMIHFAHFEKRAERVDKNTYRLNLKYNANDETELVIRILSFGPLVKVTEPESFVELIRERLTRQYKQGII